jgi:hypothetical protein
MLAGGQRLRLVLAKDWDEMTSKLKLNNNGHIALIIDLNQTPGPSDLAIIKG